MSAPKRLWSGGWEQESAAISDELAELRARRPDPAVEAAPAPEPPERDPWLRRLRAALRNARARLAVPRLRLSPRVTSALPVAVVLLCVLAAGAYGLSAMLGSTEQPAAASVSGPSGPVNWLGMQIETMPPGAVVVATVAPGSTAEQAGLEPGDMIVAVNGKPVQATGDISRAINGLGMGDVVELQVSRGSTQFTTHATLAAPPSSYP